MTLRAVELFAGGGGLALGAEDAGFRHVALLEWLPAACETLRHRDGWRDVVMGGDIRLVFDAFKRWRDADGGLDLITGGPPCQPFSMAGKRLGPEDPRNMFPHVVRAVDQARPRAFLFENVPDLLTWRDPETDRPYFEDEVRRPLEEALHYVVAVGELNAADFGVPQARRRVFTIGFKKRLGVRWTWPALTHSEDALLWAQYVDGSYWREHGLQPCDPPTGLVERVDSLAKPTLKCWRTVRDAIKDLPLRPPAEALRSDLGLVHEQRLDLPASTITATHWNNKLLRTDDGGLRYLTIRELARLQAFPDEWRFAGRDDDEKLLQIGNAVPPPMAAALMAAVRDALA